MTDLEPKRALYTRPQRLKDDAYNHLKNQIIAGHIAPGSVLSEREIAAALNMSKTPVKAALERLEEQGFLIISPQRGAIMRALTPRQITEHYDLRIALESFVVEGIGGRLTPEDREGIERNLTVQHRVVVEEQAWDEWAMADFEFHRRLCAALGNSEIERIMDLQQDRFQWLVMSIAHRDPSVPSISSAEHAAIYEAVCAGDKVHARELLVRHLENGKRFYLLGGPYGGGVD